MELRKLTPDEERLIIALLGKAIGLSYDKSLISNLLVKQMEDGSMGSLRLYPNGVDEGGRKFGLQVSEIQFTDTDGTIVLASLYVDNLNQLYEVDIWKTDFSPLIKISENFL